MKTIIWLMYAALSIYCLLDGIHTAILLDIGFEEANPLMSFFVEYVGMWSMFAMKVTWLGLLGVFLLRYTRGV